MICIEYPPDSHAEPRVDRQVSVLHDLAAADDTDGQLPVAAAHEVATRMRSSPDSVASSETEAGPGPPNLLLNELHSSRVASRSDSARASGANKHEADVVRDVPVEVVAVLRSPPRHLQNCCHICSDALCVAISCAFEKRSNTVSRNKSANASAPYMRSTDP